MTIRAVDGAAADLRPDPPLLTDANSPFAPLPNSRGRVEDESPAPPAVPVPIGLSPTDVAEHWRTLGAVRHLETGLPTLDKVTRGGLAVPRRVIVVGAPGAGKTYLTTWWVRRWAAAGVHVGMLAVDEDAEDVTVRLAQMAGHSVADCEARASWTIDAIAHDLAKLSTIRLYAFDVTIEAAAADLARRAPEGLRVLIVDSLQTARCEAALAAEASGRSVDERTIVSANAAALREVSSRFRMLVVATSEAPRSQYATSELAASANRMASAKGSGTVEYSAETLLYLSSLAGESDLVQVDIPKNRRGAKGPTVFFLRLDRERHALEEVGDPRPATESRGQARAAEKSAELEEHRREVARIVEKDPGIGSRLLADRVRHRCGCGSDRARLAINAALDEGDIEDRPEPRGRLTDHHYHPHVTDVTVT